MKQTDNKLFENIIYIIGRYSMIDPEFIKRATEFLAEEVKIDKIRNYENQWLTKNPDRRKECISRYAKTEKGMYANSKKRAKRRSNMQAACEDLDWEERIAIGRFYKNCPRGYEVDHIIPIARGGKHRLSNLQYLTRSENAEKGKKLPNELEFHKIWKRLIKEGKI